MNQPTNPVSVSTWSLHSLLGHAYPGRPGQPDAAMVADAGVASLDLLEVPARLAEHGFHTMEMCHFHLPTRDTSYLAELRAALDQSNIVLWSLLIDDGDITHPEHGDRDAAWIANWVDVAGALGASCARIIAGKQSATPQTMAQSRSHLAALAARGKSLGVQINTENWFALLATPKDVHELLHSLDGAVGLCLDFGNWGGVQKYENLAAIAPLATACHAKCDFHDGAPDRDGYNRCLAIARDAHYSGPLTLVYGEPEIVWESLATQKAIIEAL